MHDPGPDASLHERLQWLEGRAREHAQHFSDPATVRARHQYESAHPTRILATQCMDGRVDLQGATRTPDGVIEPLCNLGGRFDAGWPYLGALLTRAIDDADRGDRGALLLITYHFSRGSECRGCAGFGYDTQAAYQHARTIQRQAEALCGGEHRDFYPLVCGYETDEDVLILHGPSEGRLDLSEWTPDRRAELPEAVADLLPDLPAALKRDLLPLLERNLEHSAEVRESGRRLELDHREWIVGVGRGFEFLQTPNRALIVGPYSPDLATPVATAAAIIQQNMDAGRIPDEGFLLLACAPYAASGIDRARAELEARFLTIFSKETIADRFPELATRMHVRTAVVDWRARAIDWL